MAKAVSFDESTLTDKYCHRLCTAISIILPDVVAFKIFETYY